MQELEEFSDIDGEYFENEDVEDQGVKLNPIRVKVPMK
jgi:hypothetical protein